MSETPDWAERYWAWHEKWDGQYKWLTDALTTEFGTPFSVINSGGGCMLIEATLENRDEVMIGDAVDGPLSSMDDRLEAKSRGESYGYAVGVYPATKAIDQDGNWVGRNKSHPLPKLMNNENRDDWRDYPKPADDDGDWVGFYENNEVRGWAQDENAETSDDVIALVRKAIANRFRPAVVAVNVFVEEYGEWRWEAVEVEDANALGSYDAEAAAIADTISDPMRSPVIVLFDPMNRYTPGCTTRSHMTDDEKWGPNRLEAHTDCHHELVERFTMNQTV